MNRLRSTHILVGHLEKPDVVKVDLAAKGPFGCDKVLFRYDKEVLSLIVQGLSAPPGILKGATRRAGLHVNPYPVVEHRDLMGQSLPGR